MRYTNTILAFLNGIKYKDLDIYHYYSNIETNTKNKINKKGDFAELYIKDLYCNSIDKNNLSDKLIEYKKYFSYVGGKNTPPDAIVFNGEAIEIKKQENLSYGDIALNSSYPADYIYNDSKLISNDCRNCEDNWTKKNMVYTILNFSTKTKELKSVWFTYGNCFAANREVYQTLKDVIQEALLKLNNLNLKETNELGKVFNIDPNGVTNLRVRGMWNINHPEKIFKEHLSGINCTDNISFKLIMLEEDFNNVDTYTSDLLNTHIEIGTVNKTSILIPNPNNANEKIKAILLHN